MKLFRFILGKFLSGLVALAAMVLLVGLWKSNMLPDSLMIPVAALVLLLVALVVVLTWSVRDKTGLVAKLILTTILVGIEGAVLLLLTQLRKAQLLPEKWMLLIGAVVTVFMVLGIVLTWLSKKTQGQMIAGLVLAAICIGILSVGSFYVWKAVNTAYKMAARTEITEMRVYMRSDDMRKLDAEFAFGVLAPENSEPDEAAAAVIQELNQDLKTTISWIGYETPQELLDALLSGELDAIILDKAILDMLEDPDYVEKINQIREAKQQTVEIKVPENQSFASLDGPFAIYISGIDARYGGVGVKTRSDVNIIAVVNPDTRQVLLVSTPRDYYVPISSSKSYLDGKKDKLTHAGLDGPEASKKTLSNLYGIDISYYFKVNFSGFVNIVDALDGITVYSEYNFGYKDDDGSYYSYQKGDNELNGKEALGFCRNRYSFASGDNQRGKNQMAVIKGVINKALSPKLLTNYTQILDAVSESMEMTVPMDVIGDLVSRQLSDGGEWNVVSYSVTGSGGYAKSPAAGGAEAYMMFPNEESVERAKELIQDVIDGKIVTP